MISLNMPKICVNAGCILDYCTAAPFNVATATPLLEHVVGQSHPSLVPFGAETYNSAKLALSSRKLTLH